MTAVKGNKEAGMPVARRIGIGRMAACRTLLLSVVLIVAVGVIRAHSANITPDLAARMNSMGPGNEAAVIITLRDQLDLQQFKNLEQRPRRGALKKALQAKAAGTQGPVAGFLARREAKNIKSFWIFKAVEYSTTVNFTIAADTGFHIDQVSGCNGTLNPMNNIYTTGPVTADCTVTADFAVDTFTVTPVPGSGGSMSPATPQMVSYNADTTFTVTPDTGYHIETVSGCGGTLFGFAYTTGPITADCSVSAAFVIDVFSLNISIQGSGNGTVSSDSLSVNCQDNCVSEFDYGTIITLTAEAEEDSRFRGWSGDCGGPDPVCIVTLDQARNVTASFSSFPWNLFLPAITGSRNQQ